MSDGSNTSVAVLLIHGTFAFKDEVEGAAWWQRNSEFHRSLTASLGPLYEVQPPKRVFTWTGANSEMERRRAASRLSETVVQFEREGRRYMLLGHSHGGSVLFDALVRSNALYPGLPHLQRWATVGTPFLRYGPDGSLLWSILSALGLLAGIATLVPLHLLVFVPLWTEFLHNPEPLELGQLFLLDVLLAGLLVGTSVRSCRMAMAQWREFRLIRERKDAFQALESRFDCFYSPEDEAINGLGSTRAFEGNLMVRSSNWWAWPYNRTIAPLGDQFIWSQLCRRSQGNDLPGLYLKQVLTAPDEAGYDGSLPDETVMSLTRRANEQIARVAARLRSALYGIAFRTELIDHLRVSAQQANAIESLVHTSYFHDPALRGTLGNALRGEDASRRTDRPAIATLPRRFLMLSIAMALVLLAAVAITSMQLKALLAPLQPRSLIETAVLQAPFLSATYQDPEIPYGLVTALATHGGGDVANRLASLVQLFDDRKSVRAALATGLAIGGRQLQSQAIVVELLAGDVTEATLPKGVLGPKSPHPSNGDLAIARALGVVNMPEQAEAFIKKFGDETGGRGQLALKVLEGLSETRDERSMGRWIERMGLAQKNSPEISIALAKTCLEILPTTTVLDPVVEGKRLVRDVRCGKSVDVYARLGQIRDATARVLAACEVARLWAQRDAADEAAAMLRRERAAFSSFPRHPLDGLAIHHVRYALGFLDIRRTAEARAILQSLQAIGGESYTDARTTQIADDNSPAERAVAWARLGETEQALRWWDQLPEEMTSLEDKLKLLMQVSAELSRSNAPLPTGEQLGKDRKEDAERWQRIVLVFVALGTFDARQSQMQQQQRLSELRSIAERAALIDNPAQRSNAEARVAERLLDAGMLRAGLAMAAHCQPTDSIELLTHAVKRFF